MLTLYHSPYSRSSTILALLDELRIRDRVDVVRVTIRRGDGSGAPDPRNPHPESKVPLLVHDGRQIRERGAIILYLTDMFPQASMGPLPGDEARGDYLSWLFYYQGVMEAQIILGVAGIESPVATDSLGTRAAMFARIETALADRPYLLGDQYSAADLLVSSPFGYLPGLVPATGPIGDWVRRCQDRASIRAVLAADAAAADAAPA